LVLQNVSESATEERGKQKQYVKLSATEEQGKQDGESTLLPETMSTPFFAC
jgi:hypothetical protein